MINRTVHTVPQAFHASTDPLLRPNPIQQSQLHTLQQLATQLGYQLNPITSQNPQSQAFYANRPSNNYRGNRRGNSRGNTRGNYNRNRDDSRIQNRSPQFGWASTQNTVYGHCNRCGIGHLPSLCPNQPGSSTTRAPPQANYVAHSHGVDNGSQSGVSWLPDTGSNNHVTPDLASLDNSEAYYGNDSLHVGDGNPLPILYIGSLKLYSPHKNL